MRNFKNLWKSIFFRAAVAVSVFTLLVGVFTSAVIQTLESPQTRFMAGTILSALLAIAVGIATYRVLKRLSEPHISSISRDIHHLGKMLKLARLHRTDADTNILRSKSKLKELDNLMLEILATNRHMEEVRRKLKEAEDIVRFANIKFSETGARYFDAILHLSKRMGMLAERYDPHIGLHLDRVSTLSKMIAKWLGLMPQRVLEIYAYAYLHDLGKIVISPKILYKETPLTKDEWRVIRNHTIFGAQIIGDVPWLETAKNIALYHHENYDGSGYPFGLSGNDIPIEAQIVKLADVYDALREKRVYKEPLGHNYATEIILNGDGRIMPTHFHPRLLEVFQENEREIRYTYELIEKKYRLGMFDRTIQLLMPKETQEASSSQEYSPGDQHRSQESC